MTGKTRTSTTTILCSALAGTALFAGVLYAQDTGRTTPALVPSPQAQAPVARGRMGMMTDRQKMMAEMTASQNKLDDLVARMNAATGPAKVDQVAAVVTELVAQHKSMHARMMAPGGMMMQMMQPGQPVATPPAAEPGAAPPGGHEAHH